MASMVCVYVDMVSFTDKIIITGVGKEGMVSNIFSVGKSMIDMKDILSLSLFVVKLESDALTQRHLAGVHGKIKKFDETWGRLSQALHRNNHSRRDVAGNS